MWLSWIRITNQQSDRPHSLFTSTNVWEQWYSNSNLCCSLNSQTEAVLYSNLPCNWNSTLLGMIYNYWETHQIISKKKTSRLQLGWWPLRGPNNLDFMLPNFPEWSMIYILYNYWETHQIIGKKTLTSATRVVATLWTKQSLRCRASKFPWMEKQLVVACTLHIDFGYCTISFPWLDHASLEPWFEKWDPS